MRQIVYTAAILLASAGQLHAEATVATPSVTGQFLWDSGYRVLAFALCIAYARKLWNGLVEREIVFADPNILDWWFWKGELYQRDTKPIRYWIEIVLTALAVFGCLLGTMFGYWQPHS